MKLAFFPQIMRIQYHVWIISAFAGFNVSCWKGYWDWYFADKSQICNFNPTDYLFTKSWPQHLQFGLETWNQVNVWEINTGKLNINCSIFRLFTSLLSNQTKWFTGSDFSNLVPVVAVIVSISTDRWFCLSLTTFPSSNSSS